MSSNAVGNTEDCPLETEGCTKSTQLDNAVPKQKYRNKIGFFIGIQAYPSIMVLKVNTETLSRYIYMLIAPIMHPGIAK